MNTFDTIIRGGELVMCDDVLLADIGIAGEKIVAIEEELSGTSKATIDATGLHIFSGVIDAHVHFNEPGRTEWEGIATGSKSVAAGGGTMFFDMPLNAHPPTLDAESFSLKQRAAEVSSRVDFALWGGLTPTNLDSMEELARCGVIGFKAFMCNSGIDDFSAADEATLHKGMKCAASLKLPVAVHAEREIITARLTKEAIARHGTSARDYLDSRPILAEVDAIRQAIDLAGETRCQLHIVHVSCAAGVQMITAARKSGLNVSCETCPHYLTLDETDMERLGGVAKCAPPLRTADERELLWNELLFENIQTVGSDHSPSLPEMKESADFFKIWGGISGAQHLLPLMLKSKYFPTVGWIPTVGRMLSTNVARIFKLPRGKGQISVGFDADLALVKLGGDFEIKREELFYRHQQSPYVGRHVQARVMQTFLRGQKVFEYPDHFGEIRGRLIRPDISL
jgi:allantoinase